MPRLDYTENQLTIKDKASLKYEVLHSSVLKERHVLETITLKTSQQVYVDKTAT